MVTKTYSITANVNDANTNLRASDGTQLSWGSFLAIGLVAETTHYYPHMRYENVTIPAGAFNISAKMRMRFIYRQGNQFTYGAIRAYLADDVATLPTSVGTASNPNLRINLSQASTPLTNTGAATPEGFDYAAPWVEYDVTAQLLEVLARPGRVNGGAIVFTGDPTGSNNFLYINSLENTANSPELVITYDEPLEDRVESLAKAVGAETKRLAGLIAASGGGGSSAPVAHLGYQPNRYYGGLRAPMDATNIQVEANRAYATPMLLDRDTPIRGLVIGVDTVVAGGNCLVGIYTAVNGAPGALLHQVAAPISVAATGFITGLLPAVVTLSAGAYFIVTLFDTAPRVRGFSPGNGFISQILGHTSAFNIFNSGSFISGFERATSTPYSSGLPAAFGSFNSRTGAGTPAAGFLTPPA